MPAYHGDPAFRDEIISRMKAHAKADELIQGTGWENGKGCAVGCILHEYRHEAGPDAIGWPEDLLRLYDEIFEGLRNGDAKSFAVEAAEAIQAGADLSLVGRRFSLWLLSESGVRDNAFDDGKAAVDTVISLLQRQLAGDMPSPEEWSAAEWSARSAAESAAESAAWSPRSAARSAAESAAWSAAESAAWSAAAWSARSAAESAAWSPRSAARSAAYKKYSKKFIELASTAPVESELQ